MPKTINVELTLDQLAILEQLTRQRLEFYLADDDASHQQQSRDSEYHCVIELHNRFGEAYLMLYKRSEK